MSFFFNSVCLSCLWSFTFSYMQKFVCPSSNCNDLCWKWILDPVGFRQIVNSKFLLLGLSCQGSHQKHVSCYLSPHHVSTVFFCSKTMNLFLLSQRKLVLSRISLSNSLKSLISVSLTEILYPDLESEVFKSFYNKSKVEIFFPCVFFPSP